MGWNPQTEGGRKIILRSTASWFRLFAYSGAPPWILSQALPGHPGPLLSLEKDNHPCFWGLRPQRQVKQTVSSAHQPFLIGSLKKLPDLQPFIATASATTHVSPKSTIPDPVSLLYFHSEFFWLTSRHCILHLCVQSLKPHVPISLTIGFVSQSPLRGS